MPLLFDALPLTFPAQLTNLRAMKAIIQRVSSASVAVEGRITGEVAQGYIILLGVTHDDSEKDAEALAHKTINLRIFQDAAGKMNLAIDDIGGDILVISQFTLYADTRKGNRPSFVRAAPPAHAEALYGHYVSALRSKLGEPRIATGVFGADMKVSLVNDGPVTIELSTDTSD